MDRRLLILISLIGMVAFIGCVDTGEQPEIDSPTEADDAPEDPTDNTDEATDGTTESDSDADSESSTPNPADGELEIHAINVGQADATLIIAPTGETMLIDSGDWRNSGETVLAYLDAQNIDQIDHLVATHGHADHIGGHDVIIEEFEMNRDGIGAVWDSGVTHTSQTYERYLDAIDEHDVTLYQTHEGNNIPFEADGLQATVVNPAADSTQPNDLHYNSVSIHVTYGGTTALFTGDVEANVEARISDEHGDAIAADLYHAGHHGSRTSSTADFIDVVEPDMAIISSAYDSQYGHPHDEVLSSFSERAIDAYWTATHGSIVFETDGDGWTISTQADATTAPDALRDEPAVDVDPWIDPRGESTSERIQSPIQISSITGKISP